MVDSVSNDNEDNRAREPDPHGQAALLLVESLIHGLLARKTLTLEEAIEIVGVAIDVQGDLADEPPRMRSSLNLLKTMKASLMQDLPRR